MTTALIFRSCLFMTTIFRSIVYWFLTIHVVSNHGISGTSVTDGGEFDDPRPYSGSNKVVGFIIQPAPKMDHYDSLILILDEYVSMCEGRKSSLTGLIEMKSLQFIQKICFLLTFLYPSTGGWNVTAKLFNSLNTEVETSNWTPKLRRLVRYRTYCYRTGEYIPVEYHTMQNATGRSDQIKSKRTA
jgi:hypothetical protein